jgi:hypothetical protein
MQTVRVYLYDQILNLQILDDGSITVEDRTVFTRSLVLYKGIDNRLSLRVYNADEKAQNITTKTFHAELVRTPQRDFVGSFAATVVDAATGRAQITIPASVINPEPVGWYYLLVKYTEADQDYMVYNDDNYQVAVPVELRLGYRVSGDDYELGENLDLGSVPELVDEIRDLGAL